MLSKISQANTTGSHMKSKEVELIEAESDGFQVLEQWSKFRTFQLNMRNKLKRSIV
jgi:hypothetical protein